eukprot:g14766.t1
MHSTFGAVLGHKNILPFKRCRLSASPATGLVGMQENNFLSDFFGCVGFLPLTTASHIRETMVKIMLTPASRLQAASRDDGGDAEKFGAITIEGGPGRTLAAETFPMGPSTCIFWCAVALGALAKGSPVESVARFLQLATEALARSYSGRADAEVAKAWAVLGYLYGFMGDEAKFKEYLAMSDTFLTTSIEQGSTDGLPLGFAEVIQHREIGDPHKLEHVYSRKQILSQLNGAASEHEVYRYVMQSFHVFEKAVFSRILNHSSGAENETFGGGAFGDEGTGQQRHLNGVPRPQELSEAMVAVWTKDNPIQFGPLEETVDRPSVRAGMGGLLINGTLLFDTARQGDVAGTCKRVSRCVEVFVRYPGLCRSVIGVHWVHILSAALVALDACDAREMYNMLRDVYNPFRPAGSSPVPPLEEWQGLSAICEDPYCRAIEGLMASDKMTAFSNRGGRPPSNETETEFYEVDTIRDTYGEPGGTNGLVGGLGAPHETQLLMSQGLSEGAIDDTDEGDIAAADWLEATHALCKAGNEFGEGRSV